MIILHVLLNYDLLKKEVLKIQCQIHILINKATILRKMKDFRSIYLQPCQFDPELKKYNGKHEKENKHSHVSVADLPDIRIGNVDWFKCGYCKKK